MGTLEARRVRQTSTIEVDAVKLTVIPFRKGN
jgi:hypothetical protein